MSEYQERDLMELDKVGNHYSKHVLAMTREDLRSKSDIAAELGYRDMVIDKLTEEHKKLREALEKSQRLMNAFGMIMVDVKRPKEDTINKLNRLISVHMDDLFSSNKKLLSEIGGEKDAQLK
ncbi:hypothetical protein AWJ09_04325 [Vibrio cholerae]|uniref:hypothetical protein n=1 Tax=Vibrio cholerae TaxID=666 RepID=UPI0007C5BA18|nr:hypothetical protein [Vibrio cholerae]KAA1217093.1 hypothetical protein F0Q05_06815 [Vibrio cholerae]KAA1219477.1 hypothetical protein F0P99_08800 [Vibrio cholerae]MTB75131.1 hypothetical protein [Vibrio cholerae O1 biovar El Tor]OAE83131.1 hypothetical protein AWJ09_04325 [Vibrio cholerae]TYW51268.1 hypothetical protein FY559_16305 [Vibrio cholerae]